MGLDEEVWMRGQEALIVPARASPCPGSGLLHAGCGKCYMEVCLAQVHRNVVRSAFSVCHTLAASVAQ